MRILPVLALLSTLALPMPVAFAQSGVAQCAGVDDDVERLACYDSIFKVDSNLPAGAVVIKSETLIPARPSGREPATITVACEANALRVAFGFAGNTMSALGRDAGLTLQYDLQAARSRTLEVNADNTAILLNGADAKAFLDGLLGSNNLTVRVTPVGSRSLNVRFRVDAILSEVAPVRASCGV